MGSIGVQPDRFPCRANPYDPYDPYASNRSQQLTLNVSRLTLNLKESSTLLL